MERVFAKSYSMKKIVLLFLGTTGAGPVYSLEMSKALYLSKRCQLQIIISKNVSNIKSWDSFFSSKKDVSYNVVDTYCHSKIGVLIGLLRFDRMQKIVDLIEDFNADILYMPFRVLWAPYICKKLTGRVRIITTLHDPRPHDGAKGIINSLSRQSFDKSLQFSDDLILLNKKDVKYVNIKYRKPVCVIPHASFSYYANKTLNNSLNSLNYRIGFFGSIAPYKGLDVLVSAFNLCKTPGLQLLIAGSGKIPEELMKSIMDNNNIELVNRYIADEEFDSLMKKVDIVVLPYKSATQSGVIPLAFAFGKPVIATNVGALSEQVPNGTGMLVDCEPTIISLAIDHLYQEVCAISLLSINAKKYALSELTWEKSADTFLNYVEN